MVSDAVPLPGGHFPLIRLSIPNKMFCKVTRDMSNFVLLGFGRNGTENENWV